MEVLLIRKVKGIWDWVSHVHGLIEFAAHSAPSREVDKLQATESMHERGFRHPSLQIKKKVLFSNDKDKGSIRNVGEGQKAAQLKRQGWWWTD